MFWLNFIFVLLSWDACLKSLWYIHLQNALQTHYHIYCKCKFIDGYVDASRVHAYNEELHQMWQESSFNLTTNHMENRK